MHEPVLVVGPQPADGPPLVVGLLRPLPGLGLQCVQVAEFLLDVGLRLLHDGLQRGRADDLEFDLLAAAWWLGRSDVVEIVGYDLEDQRVAVGERFAVGVTEHRQFQPPLGLHDRRPQS